VVELSKSVHICQSYHKKKGRMFGDSRQTFAKTNFVTKKIALHAETLFTH